ncbi:MAG: xanthine dehydrogenase small subunit [Pontibacterium sp.]
MIRFFLNAQAIEVESVAPDMTVLAYLRTQLKQTDVKEGCGSGDCGACTLVEISQDEGSGRLIYRAFNSCITYLGNLHGKWLLTASGIAQLSEQPTLNFSAVTQGTALATRIASAPSSLHPVQQALVDCHGSQCGFCTPGFVMSMFALYQTQTAPSVTSKQTEDASYSVEAVESVDPRHELGGNLCRCTGYVSIEAACHEALAGEVSGKVKPRPEVFDQLAPKVFAWLNSGETGASAKKAASQKRLLDWQSVPSMHTDDRYFFVPQRLKQLHQLRLAFPQAKLVAGGTDAALATSVGYEDNPCLISTAQVKKLTRITFDEHQVTVGAAVTFSALEAQLAERLPAFTRLLQRVGSRQIRNTGTLGGNIMSGSPIGDSMPLLMCLRAQLHLETAQAKGVERRRVALTEFYTGYKQSRIKPGETLVAISFDLPDEHSFVESYKVSKRIDDDISTVCLALSVQLQAGIVSEVKIALGGMAATVIRLSDVERILLGKPWNHARIEEAQAAMAKLLTPMSDARASAGYRLRCAQNLLMRGFYQSAEKLQPTADADLANEQTHVVYTSLNDYPSSSQSQGERTLGGARHA